jgi:hypothetical protein
MVKLLTRKMKYQALAGPVELYTLFDTGAEVSSISRTIAEQNFAVDEFIPLKNPLKMVGIVPNEYIESRFKIEIQLKIEHQLIDIELYIIADNASHDPIEFGLDVIQQLIEWGDVIPYPDKYASFFHYFFYHTERPHSSNWLYNSLRKDFNDKIERLNYFYSIPKELRDSISDIAKTIWEVVWDFSTKTIYGFANPLITITIFSIASNIGGELIPFEKIIQMNPFKISNQEVFTNQIREVDLHIRSILGPDIDSFEATSIPAKVQQFKEKIQLIKDSQN